MLPRCFSSFDAPTAGHEAAQDDLAVSGAALLVTTATITAAAGDFVWECRTEFVSAATAMVELHTGNVVPGAAPCGAH